MGTNISVGVTVKGFVKTKRAKIIEALQEIWVFEDESSTKDKTSIYMSGTGSTAFSFADGLGYIIGETIFKANGKKKALIEATVTWLDQAPTEAINIPEEFLEEED